MNTNYQENLKDTLVTYTLEINGQFYIIENVPARVNTETGEQYFSPETAEQIQKIIREKKQPHHFIQTPVYHFVA